MFELFGIEITWRMVLDIALVALIYYYLITLVRGTRAVAMIYGLIFLLLAYHVSGVFGLYTLNGLLNEFLSSIFLVVIILFQKDIRKALSQLGAGRVWRRAQPVEQESFNQMVVAVMSLARNKTGAILVIERNMPLGDIIERGVEIDAKISRDLLVTIFNTETPLHDGAIVISGWRIKAASCVLPLSSKFRGQTMFGTRHRAALGISEEADCAVVVVSEETGEVSVAVNGRLTTSLDEARLRRVLINVMEK